MDEYINNQGVENTNIQVQKTTSRVRLPRLKILIISLLALIVLLIAGLIVFVNKKKVVNFLSQSGILKTMRNAGILRINTGDYFTALKEQNLLYDLNGDGAVTGEDYKLVIMEADKNAQSGQKPVEPSPAPAKGSQELQVKGLASEVPAAAENISLPSVKGSASDGFTGSASTAYPIELPPGPAGLEPSVSLSYSSGSVDDLFTGVETKWRNDAVHPYQKQAGIVGLGWNLNSGGMIYRDTQGTLNDTADDTFGLAFGGGSANLTLESDDGYYSVWRTVPNLKTKVERWSRCKPYTYDGGSLNICRYSWKVTTADGTKYYFGPTQTLNNWQTTNDPEIQYFIQGAGYDWYPLNIDNATPGYTSWLIYGSDIKGWHALVYEWNLSQVESVFNVDGSREVKIKYLYKYGLGDYAGKKYVSAVYPYKINYGQNEVEFVREPRLDYKTHLGDNSVNEQPFRSMERIRKILVKTSNKVVRAYVLDYKYGWVPAQHYDTNNNGVADNIGEVKDGQVIHSLLFKITPWGGDPGY